MGFFHDNMSPSLNWDAAMPERLSTDGFLTPNRLAIIKKLSADTYIVDGLPISVFQRMLE